MTRQAVLERFARKLTELDDQSVQLTGSALSLREPLDLAATVVRRAGVLMTVVGAGLPADAVADALGATLLALELARARDREETTA